MPPDRGDARVALLTGRGPQSSLPRSDRDRSPRWAARFRRGCSVSWRDVGVARRRAISVRSEAWCTSTLRCLAGASAGSADRALTDPRRRTIEAQTARTGITSRPRMIRSSIVRTRPMVWGEMSRQRSAMPTTSDARQLHITPHRRMTRNDCINTSAARAEPRRRSPRARADFGVRSAQASGYVRACATRHQEVAAGPQAAHKRVARRLAPGDTLEARWL